MAPQDHLTWHSQRAHTCFFIPMGGIEEENKRLTLDFDFVGPDEMTHKVPNISIYGNKCPIPTSRRSGCVLYRNFQRSCKGPSRPPRTTGSSSIRREMASVVWFPGWENVNVSCQTQEGRPYGSKLWVSQTRCRPCHGVKMRRIAASKEPR